MGRKDTVWGARHRSEAEEIERIIKEFDKMFGVNITKLEASAILAERSRAVFWTKADAKRALQSLRGVL